MAKQIRYGAYADFQPEKMVTAELACVTSGDPAVSDGMSLHICFSPGVVKRITTYADFEREIENATQEIQDAFTEDVQAVIQAAIEATNNANDAITQANEARDQALSAAESAEEAAEAALAAAGGDISEKTVTFESQDAENPEEWTDVDVLATGTKLSLLFQKVSSMFKNIRFLKKKTDELDLGVNELNTKLKPYTQIFASTNLSESGTIKKITNYNDFIILVSASGFVASHFATKEVLINGPVFASSYYYNANQHGMATIQLYAGGAYQIGKGVNQNSPSSSVAIYAR